MITEKDVLDYIYAHKDDETALKTINNMTYAFLNLLNWWTKKKVESKSNYSNLPDEEFTQKLNGYG